MRMDFLKDDLDILQAHGYVLDDVCAFAQGKLIVTIRDIRTDTVKVVEDVLLRRAIVKFMDIYLPHVHGFVAKPSPENDAKLKAENDLLRSLLGDEVPVEP